MHEYPYPPPPTLSHESLFSRVNVKVAEDNILSVSPPLGLPNILLSQAQPTCLLDNYCTAPLYYYHSNKHKYLHLPDKGSCELPKEEKKVTQPVERSEEPRHDRGYTIADPEEEPEDSDYEYKNTHEFFHNNSATRIVKSDPCRLLYSLTSFLLTMVIRR